MQRQQKTMSRKFDDDVADTDFVLSISQMK